MSRQSPFTIHGRNPDVLTCIANLSNDEVFTPPEFANQMLDTLAEAWAADNGGASIWENPDVTFLDPCTKSGVFLREITTRLTKGLEQQIPDLRERVDHILTRQVFGIGITELTALLARRSVYCSKHAQGKHSIARSFTGDDGRIWYERLEHTWRGTKCRYCGAPRAIFDRHASLETHAYAFIHTDDIKARIAGLFGDDMQFDVIIGNPPYQMTGGGGGFDSSIYHLFVEQAMRLEPRFLSMVIPSRWMAGGHGMDDFRSRMLTGRSVKQLVDFPVSKDVFPGVEVKGGISYFLWDHSYHGQTSMTTIRGAETIGPVSRDLDEFDILVRSTQAVDILRKVLSLQEPAVSEILTGVEPFKWASNFSDFRDTSERGGIPLYYWRRGRRSIGYVDMGQVSKNQNLVDSWKVLTPKAGSGGGMVPDYVLGKPWIAPPPSVCTGSFMFFYLSSEMQARSLQSYYCTKFFRFLVSLRKITQDAIRSTYGWVPQQQWNCEWTDSALYDKYALTQQQIAYIESVIKPMTINNDDD